MYWLWNKILKITYGQVEQHFGFAQAEHISYQTIRIHLIEADPLHGFAVQGICCCMDIIISGRTDSGIRESDKRKFLKENAKTP